MRPIELAYGDWDDQRAARIAAWPPPSLGIGPDPDWRDKRGLAATLRLSPATAPIVAGYSTGVQGVLGEGNSVVYDESGAHVTVATLPMPLLMLNPEEYDAHVQSVLFAITDCVARAVAQWQKFGLPQPSTTFERIVANASTAVIAAKGSQSLYRLRCLIVENLRAHPDIKRWKLKIKGSWGAHVTFSRFLVKLLEGDLTLAQLTQLLSEMNDGLVCTERPLQFLDVSQMTCTGGTFRLDRYQSFALLG